MPAQRSIPYPPEMSRGYFLGSQMRTDRETGAQMMKDGIGQWQALVGLVHKGEPFADPVMITVTSEVAPAASMGDPVKVSNLEARPWTYEGRSGISYSATSVDVLRQAKAGEAQ